MSKKLVEATGESAQNLVEALTEADAKTIADAAPQLADALGRVRVQFGFLGAICGATAGAAAAFAIAYRKAEAKYSKIADAEIEQMKAHYEAKRVALEADVAKGDLNTIVKERGYGDPAPDIQTSSIAPQPMAIQPPSAIVDEAAEPDKQPPIPGQSVSAVQGTDSEPETQNVFEDQAVVDHNWDYHKERANRSPDIPYVIHYDERNEFEGYQDVTLTYYEGDDVLCDERDDVIDQETRDNLIGELNLERFGHGSNDPAIVYVRNDKMEIVYEVIRSPNTYTEEVHGLKHEEFDRGNLRRMRRSEREYED